MAGKIPTKIIELVKAKSGKISSIEIAIALNMDNSEENLDRVYVEISKLARIGRLRYLKTKVRWVVPGKQTRMRTLIEIVQDDDLSNARDQLYSKNMEKVLGMLLDGMSTKDIAKQSKLDEKCVKDMTMAMTTEDGKTRRQSMRNIASAARCKKMVAEKKKDVPSKRRSTWVKPQLVSSIFALAQGQYIDMPTR